MSEDNFCILRHAFLIYITFDLKLETHNAGKPVYQIWKSERYMELRNKRKALLTAVQWWQI